MLTDLVGPVHSGLVRFGRRHYPVCDVTFGLCGTISLCSLSLSIQSSSGTSDDMRKQAGGKKEIKVLGGTCVLKVCLH